MNGLTAAIDRLRDWYIGSALPLWANAGADPSGAFYESLDFDGRPIAGQKRRVRVQCRQVHVFTDAGLRGWLPNGESIATAAFARLVETACPKDGARGCVHALNDDGGVADHLRDLYDQAFLLLASAARIRSAGDSVARDLAERTLAFLDREFASPHGGYRENDRGGLPRRQNPHMHLFEALTALSSATGEAGHLERARTLDALFRTRFLDHDRGVLREFFNDDWSLIERVSDNLEPGHMAEWVSLLGRFEQAANVDRGAEKRMLYASAPTFAASGDAPFLPNAARLGQRTVKSARRLWPQTEYLRATLLFAGGGDTSVSAKAVHLIDSLFETYLDQPTRGIWQDEYDADGVPIAKDVPASILYHLHEAVCAAVECRDKLAA